MKVLLRRLRLNGHTWWFERLESTTSNDTLSDSRTTNPLSSTAKSGNLGLRYPSLCTVCSLKRIRKSVTLTIVRKRKFYTSSFRTNLCIFRPVQRSMIMIILTAINKCLHCIWHVYTARNNCYKNDLTSKYFKNGESKTYARFQVVGPWTGRLKFLKEYSKIPRIRTCNFPDQPE